MGKSGTLSAVRERHVPERTCAACRRKRPQAELLRLSRSGAGWSVDKRPRQGRGVYVCADSAACWNEKKLRRAFGAQAIKVAEQLAAGQLAAGQLLSRSGAAHEQPRPPESGSQQRPKAQANQPMHT